MKGRPPRQYAPEMIEEMKRLRASGKSFREIGAQFGVSTTMACNLVRGLHGEPNSFQVARVFRYEFPLDSVRGIQINVVGPFDQDEWALIFAYLDLVRQSLLRTATAEDVSEPPQGADERKVGGPK